MKSVLLIVIIVLTDTACTASTNWSNRNVSQDSPLRQLSSKQNVSAGNNPVSHESICISVKEENYQRQELSTIEGQDISISVGDIEQPLIGNQNQTWAALHVSQLSMAASNRRPERISSEIQTPVLPQVATSSTVTQESTEHRNNGNNHNATGVKDVSMTLTERVTASIVSRKNSESPATTTESGKEKNPSSSEFLSKMVEFVEYYDMCSSKAKLEPSRSCKDRCGRKVLYQESYDKCSCDELCSIYNDCCADFYVLCPDVFERSQGISKPGVQSECNRDSYYAYKVVTSCPDGETSFTEAEVFSTRFSTVYTFLPVSGLTALAAYATFFIADIFTGVVYENRQTYECNRGKRSVSYTLPHVFPITDVYQDGQSIESYVFSDMDKMGKYFYLLESRNMEMRGCLSEETIYCQEFENVGYTVLVNRVCDALASGKVSELQLTWSRNAYEYEVSDILRRNGSCWHMRQKLRQIPDLKNAQHQAYVSFTRASVFSEEYDVEFQGTPWKKLRCSSYRLRLDECDLEECSVGFWPGEKGGCFSPQIVKVEFPGAVIIPMCSCFMVYVTVEGLMIWELGGLSFRDNICEIPLALQSDSLARNTDGNSSYKNTGHKVVLKAFGDELDENLDKCDDVYSTISIWFARLPTFQKPSNEFGLSITQRKDGLIIRDATISSPASEATGARISSVQNNFRCRTTLFLTSALLAKVWGRLLLG